MVNFINTPPKAEVYDRAVKQFGVDFDKGIVFTYGENIHSKETLTQDLLVHEMVHVRQQTTMIGGEDAWWEKYFTDPKFRIKQELEAYQAQYKFVVENIKDRNERARHLFFFATSLSGDMYGRAIPYSDATRLIRNNIK